MIQPKSWGNVVAQINSTNFLNSTWFHWLNGYNARCEPVQAAFTHKAFTARSQGVDTKIINENGNNC